MLDGQISIEGRIELPMTAFGRRRARVAGGILALSLVFAPAAQAEICKDTTIEPGETIALDLKDARSEVPVHISDSYQLPAGWSTWSRDGVMHVFAPASAAPGETATFSLVDDDDVVLDEVEVVIAGEAPSSSSNSSWLSSFFDSVSQLFN